MKLITRDSDYAMRALCVMAQESGKILSVDDIASETNVSHHFLRKILQVLSRKNIIKSYKGKGGGFVLSRDPKKINFIDIMEIFQGSLVLAEHKLNKDKCPKIKKCNLKKKIDKIERGLLRDFNSITVASILDN
ncbi:MAG: Rrf2 family transcriptional regulator [Candidatus Kaelpia aquatica]|nr:Rrf2 family transcriptional regulator [Candidatus Kaelpia aquatica]